MANTYSATIAKASSQDLYCADNVPLSITGDLTIEFWIKITSTPSSFYFLTNKSLGMGSNRSYELTYNGTQLVCNIFASPGDATNMVQCTLTQTLTVGTWFHVAMVFTVANSNATKFSWYINGASAGNGSVTAYGAGVSAIFDSTAAFSIGMEDHGNIYSPAYLDAKMDEVRIWSVARTSAQIAANYQTELVGNETGLNAYWKLNNSLVDSTSNAITLTNANSVTFTTDVPFVGATFTPKVMIF